MNKYFFDYTKYKDKVLQILNAVDKIDNWSWNEFRKILSKYPKDNNKFFSKTDLLKTYSKLTDKERQKFVHDITARIRLRPVRTLSGVTTVTVLTKPYPCPGRCIFCPNEPDFPKSYLANEPGAQRAFKHKFDPYTQTYKRLKALNNIGHNTQKIEIIILGGTWTAYPLNYQIWFVKEIFRALNDFSVTELEKTIKLEISSEDENELWDQLFAQHKINESSNTRCVGLVIETRPDELDEETVLQLRKLGATKVQIGVQSLDDKVLSLNQRGHDVSATKKAFELLRLAGFKIHAHWMPNLLGSTPKQDIEDFTKLVKSEYFKPDELKIYPCSLIAGTKLMDEFKKGNWKPYSFEELLYVLISVVQLTPRYTRITRMIRDIPSDDIVEGNKFSNFRQIVDQELKRLNAKIVEIRSREIGTQVVSSHDLIFKTTEYETSISKEYFLEYVTEEDKIAGFLRLSIPKSLPPCQGGTEGGFTHPFLPELDDSAMIREVHVYGQVLDLGKKQEGKAQHLGLGTKLIQKAEEIAKANGFQKLAVISAVGTREYYRKMGFQINIFYQQLFTK